jgi:hypothetical protein
MIPVTALLAGSPAKHAATAAVARTDCLTEDEQYADTPPATANISTTAKNAFPRTVNCHSMHEVFVYTTIFNNSFMGRHPDVFFNF